MNYNIEKQKRLGMPFGTASAKLRKMIMFDLLKELKRDICFQCNLPILEIEELSIEHKKPYFNSENPIQLFFDLENIAFSHLNCNIKAGKGYKGTHKEFCKRGHKFTEENSVICIYKGKEQKRCLECRRTIEYPKRKR